MDTTIIALRNLYVAMGGTAADVANLSLIPDLINAIAELISSGATAELPSVRALDAGRVLTVSNTGKWVAAGIPSQLPTVTDDDEGKVLKVVGGAWNKGTDETSST